jgi:hypothetical protein
MNRLARSLPGGSAVLLLALVAIAAPASGAEGVAVVHYTPQAYPVFVQQLNSGQVAAVTFNKRLRSMRVTLKNGQHVLVKYPPHQADAEIARVKGKHVAVTVLSPAAAKAETPKKTPHHKLRYIAGGVLVIVIVIVGAVLYIVKKRRRDSE